jgi:hypothetical protein
MPSCTCLSAPARAAVWVRRFPAEGSPVRVCEACLQRPGVLFLFVGDEESALPRAVTAATPIGAEVWTAPGRAVVARPGAIRPGPLA